jgi:hypothetical protein
MNTLYNARMLAVGLSLLAATAFAAPRKTVALKTGTVLPVTLDRDLSSDHSRKGDTFTATVRSGYLGLPEGTQLKGIVRNAIVKTGDKPGVLVLEFTRIMPPDANSTAIDGSPVSLDSKSTTTGRDGRIVAKPGVKNKRLTYVGYGAGAGLLLSLLDGGKNTVRNTVLGAAAGYVIGALDKGGQKQPNNVQLKSGLAMGVLLHAPVAVRF